MAMVYVAAQPVFVFASSSQYCVLLHAAKPQHACQLRSSVWASDQCCSSSSFIAEVNSSHNGWGLGFSRFGFLMISRQRHLSCRDSPPCGIVVVEGGSSCRRKLGLRGARSVGPCSVNSFYFSSSRLTANNNSNVKEQSLIIAAASFFLKGLCGRGRETSGSQESYNSRRDDGKVAGRTKTVSFSTFRGAVLRKQSFTRLEKLEDFDSATIILDTTAATARERSSGGDMPPFAFPTTEEKNDLPHDHDELKAHSKTVYAKLDSSSRLRTPRAARELTLGILYAALASKLPPMGIFEDRMRIREAFSKVYTRDIMEDYNLPSADGAPVFVQDKGNATKLEAAQEEEAIIEAAVLTAPLPLVYNRFVLRMARRIIKATSDRWLLQEPIVKQLIPIKWKEEKGRLIERCILHMAIAEIELVGTSPNIVVDEAVELAKRLCDGLAPRVINGCLGSYCRSRQLHKNVSIVARELETSQALLFPKGLGWNDENHENLVV